MSPEQPSARLTATIEGERGGVPVELLVSIQDGALVIVVPSVKRAARVQFRANLVQLHAAIAALTPVAKTVKRTPRARPGPVASEPQSS